MLHDDLRPVNIADFVGMSRQLEALSRLYEDGKAPRMMAFYGEPGSGKTSLARSLAIAARNQADPFSTELSKLTDAGIKTINAADENGVDDVRRLIENSSYAELDGGPRVVILNEAHQLTKQAQSALLDFAEFPPDGLWLFITTSEPGAINKALSQRFFTIVTKPLSSADVATMVKRGLDSLGEIGRKVDAKALTREILDSGANFPREVLINVERVAYGQDVIIGDESKQNAFAAVQALTKGDSSDVREYLTTATDQEARSLRFLVLSYLNTMAMKSASQRAADAILKVTGPYPPEVNAFKPWLVASLMMVERIFKAK